jgi:methyl-accepting chemotaxis protein
MGEIVASVQRVSDIIGEVMAAAAEQSQGIAQVNDSVSQLDQMTQQNAALVEQTAASAESLKDQADRLASLVSTFRLDEPGTPALRPAAAAAAALDQVRVQSRAASRKPPAAPLRPAAAARSAPPEAPAMRDADWETF